jgi:cytidylate kinase
MTSQTSNSPIIVAIDGYSSSGKSTMAKQLAAKLSYRYIDSGAMYRAVTLYALDNGLFNGDGALDTDRLIASLDNIAIDFALCDDGTQHTTLNGVDVEKEIRTMRVSSQVSTVAAVPAVRHQLVKMQQAFGASKGIVMDGRDIGTTVFPDAEVKIFVNASAETRAQRRYDELKAKGEEVTYDEILANVKHRDHIDETREESPLRRADDAIDLDNSNMTRDEQNQRLLQIVQQALA